MRNENSRNVADVIESRSGEERALVAAADTFEVDIEGRMHPWASDEISTADIVRLAGFAPGTQVLEIDDDNNQRTLAPTEVVKLKPGHGFAKRHRFRRG